MKEKEFKRIYVWQLPVRIFHWVNAFSIVVLAITGIIIADPPALQSNHEAYETYYMGYVRVTHFIAAYFFVAAMLLRIYWAFVGNKFAHWKSFVPFTKKWFSNLFYVIKHDVFLLPYNEKKSKLLHIKVGHNSLASFTYLIMFILALIMVFTGFGLYAQNTSWWLPKLFSWVPVYLGGDFTARLIHHITMWLMLFLIFIHIYFVIFHDVKDKDGEVSSMINGHKFEPNK